MSRNTKMKFFSREVKFTTTEKSILDQFLNTYCSSIFRRSNDRFMKS